VAAARPAPAAPPPPAVARPAPSVAMAPPAAPVTPRPMTSIAVEPPAAPRPPPIYRVQLGLYNTETAALAEWNVLKGRFSQQLGNLQLRVVPALVAKNRMRRLEAGPFRSRDEAEAACKSIRNAGQACVILGG